VSRAPFEGPFGEAVFPLKARRAIAQKELRKNDRRLNHVAIAVADIEKASKVYASTLGAKVTTPEIVAEHGVRVVFVELPNTKTNCWSPMGKRRPLPALSRKTRQAGFITYVRS